MRVMRAQAARLWLCLLAAVQAGLALRLLAEPDARGFDCAIVVRGTASLAPGNAYSDQGPAIMDAITFWAEWVNDTHGGIAITVGEGDQRTCGIDLWIDDDLSDPAVAVAYYEAYMEEADMVTGPYSSSLAGPAGDVSEAHEMLMISGGASTTSIYEGRQYMFGMETPTELLLELIMRALSLRGAKTISYLHEDTTYTNAVCESLDQLIQGLTMTELGGVKVPPDADDQNLTVALQELKELNADVVVGCTYAKVCHNMLKIADQIGLEPKAFVFSLCVSQPQFIVETGFLGNYIIGASQWEPNLGYTCEITGWTTKQYSEMYRERFNSEPTWAGSAYFGGLLAWVQAVEKVGSIQTSKVALQLSKASVETIYGKIGFDENTMYTGDPNFVQFMNYERKIIQPESIADAAMVYPMPTWSTQRCIQEFGENDCRCFPEGCPACKRSDYTVTISDCDSNGHRTIEYYLPPFICNREKGVDLPSSSKTACGYIPLESSQGIIVLTITSLAVAIILVSSAAVLQHRKNKFVMAAQPLFLLLFLGGTLLVLVGNTMPMDEVTAAQCQSMVWVLLLGLDVMLGSINVKLYRIWRIFGNRRLVRVKVTEKDMLRVIGLIVGVDCLLIGGWMLFYSPTEDVVVSEEYDFEWKLKTCHVTEVPLLWGSLAMKVFMLATACFFSHQTRNVDRKFLQSNMIMYALYQIFLMALIGICVYSLMDNETDKLFVRMFVIVLAVVGAVVFIVVCRLISVYKQIRQPTEPTAKPHSGVGSNSTPPADGTHNQSVDVDEFMSAENFAELLFSPAALMAMTNRMNELEDENRRMREQIEQIRVYLETGVIADEIKDIVSRPSRATFARNSMYPPDGGIELASTSPNVL